MIVVMNEILQNFQIFEKIDVEIICQGIPKKSPDSEIRIYRVFFANWVRIGSIGPNQIIFQIWELQLKLIPQKIFLCDQRHFYYVSNLEVAWYEFIPQNSSS